MSSLRDEPPIEPLLDTWGRFNDAARWRWSLRTRPASDEAPVLNAWGAGQVAEFLEALRPIARVRQAFFNGPPDSPPLAVPEHTWNERQESHARFESALLEAVRTSPTPITSAELRFDLYVWVRTPTSGAPVRGWVAGTAESDLQFETRNPYGSLTMDHTLFRDGATYWDANTTLHRLNSPLLRQALAAIEARLGPIQEVEGLPDVTRTGFESIR
ncbi:MAG TPA: hypothetical protein VF815_44460 [Myxococcaceae bacterium]